MTRFLAKADEDQSDWLIWNPNAMGLCDVQWVWLSMQAIPTPHPQQLGEADATGVMMWIKADAKEIQYGRIHHTPPPKVREG